MTSLTSSPVIVLPGANGRTPDLGIFCSGSADLIRIEAIGYPGWQRYIANDFSAEVLIEDLAEQIANQVPLGPIRIIGISIGGHFGYAAALRLQSNGREIAGFCAIDTFMIDSSEPSAGWKAHALARGLELIRQRDIKELVSFLRSRFWRALFRLSRDRLRNLLRLVSSSDRLSTVLAFDRIFEEELSMRLLIREVAPWIGSLDRKPVALNAPAVLLRTAEAARDDEAWRRRCPNIEIVEIPGKHHTTFDTENVSALRDAFITATRGWNTPAAAQGRNR